MIPFFEAREESFTAVSAVDMTFPLHLHAHMELVYQLSGEMEVTVRKQSQLLRPGDLALIFPNQVHCYSTRDHSCAILLICGASLAGPYASVLAHQHPANPFLPGGELHPDIPYALNSLRREAEAGGAKGVYSPFVQLTLARALPLLSLHPNRGADSLDLIHQLIHYISEHFQEPLSLESLARHLGVSKYHLSHVFSERLNMTFPDYLSSIRLSYACELLTATAMSVTEIGEASGFESERTFFRAFQKNYHTTPRKYRVEMNG